MDQVTDPQRECLLLIVALKYALAGDLESAEPLNQIEARFRAINWTDPAFVQFTESARAAMPAASLSVGDPFQTLLHMLHYYVENDAASTEALHDAAAEVTRAREGEKAALALAGRIAKILQLVAPLFSAMRDELALLGADVTPHEDAIRSIQRAPTDFSG